MPRPPDHADESLGSTSPRHSPARRTSGRRALRRWTLLGLAGVAGLTAVAAGLAYDVTSTQEAARAKVVDQARAAYQRRLAAEDANLATVRSESRRLAVALAHEHAVLVARQQARQRALAALAAAQARARAASVAPVYVSATVPASHTVTTTAAPRRTSEDSASATSGGS
jgi:hypothetical protein